MPLDVLGFKPEKINLYRIKYSTQHRGYIRPPAGITLFKGQSNEKHVPTEVFFDEMRHFLRSNLTLMRRIYCGKKAKDMCINPLMTTVPHHIETSQLICTLNQLTSFYMMGNTGR